MISGVNELVPGAELTITTVNNEVFHGTYTQDTKFCNVPLVCLKTESGIAFIATSAIVSII